LVETLKAWFRNLNRFYLKWWHSTRILQNITNRTPLVMLITSTQQTCDHLMSFWTYSESLKLAHFFWISVDHLLYFQCGVWAWPPDLRLQLLTSAAVLWSWHSPSLDRSICNAGVFYIEDMLFLLAWSYKILSLWGWSKWQEPR